MVNYTIHRTTTNRSFHLIEETIVITNFIFGKHAGSSGLTVEVPAGIYSKRTLLELLGIGLKFPDYYGVNWDAFEECIRDLSWLSERNITIFHHDIPLSNNNSDARTYLLVLRDAVSKWTDEASHQMSVVFPSELQENVESLIGSEP